MGATLSEIEDFIHNFLRAVKHILELPNTFFLISILTDRLRALLCIDIVTSLNKKKKGRLKSRSETIACLVLWCSGDVESNPGPACDDLREFSKKMISRLVIRY